MYKYQSFIFGLLLILFSSCQEGKTGTYFIEPDNPHPVNPEKWNDVEKGLNVAFGDIDNRYKKELYPQEGINTKWQGTAWSGERINLQIVTWSTDTIKNISIAPFQLKSKNSTFIPASNVKIHPVKYVLTDIFLNGCGWRNKDTIPSSLSPDILAENQIFNLEGYSTRPVWITIDVPEGTKPGIYNGEVTINYNGRKETKLPVSLEVEKHTLPEPSNWNFHLDLWQNPYAVARYYDVTPWSDKHMELLFPYLKMLANAGQKCITTTIVHKPWGGQTYDHFESMIDWIHSEDAKWEFDYTNFDKWVNLAMMAGITKQINCYSMVPWGNQVRYYDTDSADYITVKAVPGSKEYKSLWTPFLLSFRNHLQNKGWLKKAQIAMDERSLGEMQEMIKLINEVTPEIKISLAGSYHPEINDDLYDLCVFHIPELEKEKITYRKNKGFITTFYTMCSAPEHPNNFTFSPTAEQTLLGWYAAAMGYDGFLRWAYNSWVENPLLDSRFRTWPAGDTYQVYPGPLSSIRFERLREGIQDYEKISIIKHKLKENKDTENLKKLETVLSSFSSETITKPNNATNLVNNAKKTLNEISKNL